MKYLFILILLIPYITFGQKTNLHTIVPQGDFDESRDMNLSWTLGEFITETVIRRDYAVTQGFQQPYFEINKLNTTDDKAIEALLYPNPTQGWLTLKLTAITGKYRVEIMDMAGRILFGKWHKDTNVLLDMSEFPSGQYIIRIVNPTAKTRSAFSVLKF